MAGFVLEGGLGGLFESPEGVGWWVKMFDEHLLMVDFRMECIGDVVII